MLQYQLIWPPQMAIYDNHSINFGLSPTKMKTLFDVNALHNLLELL